MLRWAACGKTSIICTDLAKNYRALASLCKALPFLGYRLIDSVRVVAKKFPKLDKIPKKYFCWLLLFFSIFSARLDKRLFFKDALIDGRALPWIDYFYFLFLFLFSCFEMMRPLIFSSFASGDRKKIFIWWIGPKRTFKVSFDLQLKDWWLVNKQMCLLGWPEAVFGVVIGTVAHVREVWFLLRSCSCEPAIMICLLWAQSQNLLFCLGLLKA